MMEHDATLDSSHERTSHVRAPAITSISLHKSFSPSLREGKGSFSKGWTLKGRPYSGKEPGGRETSVEYTSSYFKTTLPWSVKPWCTEAKLN